jgi:hypothetical protein
MAQDITIDTTAYADGSPLTEAKLDAMFAVVETAIEDVLNGIQAHDSVLLNTTAEAVAIAAGVATITRAYAELTSQSGTSDDVDTITLTNGKFAFVRAASGHTIVLKHGTANITVDGGGNVTLSGNETALVFAAGSQVGVIGYGASGGGSGIGGSTGATDNALLRANGTGGATAQNSTVIVDDNGVMTGASVSVGSGVIKTLASDVIAAGNDRNLIVAAQSGTSDNLIEVTGLAVGESVLLRADAGDTITVVHNSGSATVKIHLHGDANVTLDEQNPLRLTLVATNVLVEDVQGSGSSSSNSYAILRHEESNGVNAGATTLNTWNACALNTESYDPDSIVSIASNQFTPIAGTYKIVAKKATRISGLNALRLYNVTGAAAVKRGVNELNVGSGQVGSTPEVTCIFTANGTDAYRFDVWTSVGNAAGLGLAISAGDNEVYLEAILEKIG